MKKIITVIILFMTFFQTSTIIAQDILKGNDLSTIKVDNLTSNEIDKIKSQLANSQISIDQAEPMVLSKGMSPMEFAKLKARLASSTINSNNVSSTGTVGDITVATDQNVVEYNSPKKNDDILVFGSELFDNPSLNFAQDLKLATPVNYILGPGDELQIAVYGVQEFNSNIAVTAEGKISIQFVGQISVSGMTIEAATQKIKGAIAKVYGTVKSGQSQVSVTLSKIRTIKVTVIGGNQPGNYSVSSLATVFNALHLAGGPGKNGSYRNIELIRNNKVLRKIDVYRFLVKGDQADNIGLRDNDVIRIPAYSQRVVLSGEVKRPGIFEMKNGETFSDLLSFASGFNEFAYTASVNVEQKTGKEFKVLDINEENYSSYIPKSGDVFKVSRILDRFENRIKIEGAVFRPDTYSFKEGMRVSDLVTKAEGLKEDAYTKRAKIIRLKSDLTSEIVNVDLNAALKGDLNANVELKREDVFTIYSVLEFREEYKISIDGEVKNPGKYPYYENLTLNDLIVQVGGFTGSASKRVEIARMIKSDSIKENDSKRVEVFNLELTPENEQIKNFPLEPFDVVNIRRLAVYEKPSVVKISGSVVYPGNYVLANKKESVYSIVMRAGGLTTDANFQGLKIKRPIKSDQIEDIENVSINVNGDNSQEKLSKKLEDEIKFATIPVNWEKIVKDKDHYSNVTLFGGDEIIVSKFNEGVKIVGNVLLTSEIPYRKNKNFNYYIDAVGGIDSKGWKKKAYIIYPNGKAAVAKSFLFFKSYPKVLPDSQIVVPTKPETDKMSSGELVSIASVVTSLALLIVTAFK
ncbi:SLBB domain-containing protein [Flavobacterium aquicola]|uniref:Protein involved in polysaccharide export with SLBB domain n=1 Tax=Flavobacterium aquicola TaxID=1682742 RepID=A0A3E0ELN6_9FLAO|nr:SLBB domain-containing protein [Flavobacterium aquicola]REG98239.1 protein involved in polysaccharide export with SLBB domain [Flavobacterium aquicola]